MRRVLIIITTAFVPYGGLTTVMMNYYRAMDKTGLKIDFASTNQPEKIILEELFQNKSEYFCLGDRRKKLAHYLKSLTAILNKKQYDVVHVNGNSATMFLELSVADKCGVPVRVAHGHTTRTSYPLIHWLLSSVFEKSYTRAIAVSSMAGDWLYGKNKYTILNNAIDVDRYRFSEKIRKQYRAFLGVENKFVIGHVGKLYKPKNHTFLLKVFAEIIKLRNNACLLLVGGGELENNLREQCRELKIERDVVFVGMQKEVEGFLQAMDVFIFPSLWEGLPLSLVEAQASGLSCLVSNNITKDIVCTKNVIYKDLQEGEIAWAKEAVSMETKLRTRCEAAEDVAKNGFDINKEVIKLKNIYL